MRAIKIKKCIVLDCKRPFYGVEYCRLHWRRWKKHGTTEPIIGHGMTHTKVYDAWRAMKNRCYWKNGKYYKNYGERGIAVCNEWLHDFEAFYAYIGDPPPGKMSIDRINNNGNYEPGNVRWATYNEQALNKRILVPNMHGLRGVYKTKDTYYSMIALHKKRTYLGSFKTPQEAHQAYIAAGGRL